ncbi:MAG: hypothetical protein EXQ93_07660 [Alphaproteobacteria bacterium]|nr:hypothetical protein [Alphaproteobacteria bacterium]
MPSSERAVGVGFTEAVIVASTATIPIVGTGMSDVTIPQLVGNVARPQGNVTGLSSVPTGNAGEELGILGDAIPSARRIGVLLWAPAPNREDDRRVLLSGAATLGIELVWVEVSVAADFAPAYATLTRERVDAVLLASGVLFTTERQQLIELAAAARLPTIYSAQQAVESGGLISHGVDFRSNSRRATTYVVAILRGAKPSDLPVQSPSFVLAINLKTARDLGLTLPAAILARADVVIE